MPRSLGWLVRAGVVLVAGFATAAPPSGDLDSSLPTMQAMITRYSADRGSIGRFHDAPMSNDARAREIELEREWLDALGAIDFDALDRDGQVDYLLFRNHLRSQLAEHEHTLARWNEMAPLLPFAETIVGLHEARRRLDPVDAEQAAADLVSLGRALEATRAAIEDGSLSAAPTVANRAAGMTRRLRSTLRSWFAFSAGYDPVFTWWVEAPHKQLSNDLDAYADFLREKLVGIDADDKDAIIGDPIGRAALLSRLEHEMIPYSPEELLAIAEQEYAWCRAEFVRAAQELGFGDDWRAALEHVKALHVGPGEQPAMIRDLAWEAVTFLEARDLVTIPELCKTTWRMEMMSPERQKVSPYFLGGESIIVSFPTDGMAHADKLMSMRGNNVHFARATVHHELIPGHHLQGFMRARHRTYRGIFSTPFWVEGWALYWEMLLWDLDFARSPEDRIGMLFWRTHRCARIVFSLSFHLGRMTAEEAIDYLVENVGHERNNATAEVRRSVSGAYGPLYQAAYMLGGLQVRALRAELVDSGRMAERDFHDAILEQNSIPIEMVRAALSDDPLSRDVVASWRFYGDVKPVEAVDP